MRYLLEINALIAYGVTDHDFHSRVSSWAKSLAARHVTEFATSPITQLGFVRILAQVPAYGITLNKARDLLLQVKQTSPIKFSFISDNHDMTHLPSWVKTAKHTTDGHLAQLAKANGAILATLDENIPDSFIIPGK